MKSVTVSAPGKIHLMGEHAVVYGAPAFLTAINRRLTVTVSDRSQNSDSPMFILEEAAYEPFLQDALQCIRSQLQIGYTHPVTISITSQFPAGFHLGSSAAVAVALTGALMNYHTGRFDVEEINRIAYEVEKIAHGTPSGGDNTIVTYGGFIKFQKHSETQKSVIPLAIDVPRFMSSLYLVNTGKPESTKDMIAIVRELFAEQPERKEPILEKNAEATALAIETLTNSDRDGFIRAVQQGEATLEAMGVVSDHAAAFIRELEAKKGAGKILGGGGRAFGVGFMLCLASSGITRLVKRYKWSAEPVTLGEPGVRIESQRNGDEQEKGVL